MSAAKASMLFGSSNDDDLRDDGSDSEEEDMLIQISEEEDEIEDENDVSSPIKEEYSNGDTFYGRDGSEWNKNCHGLNLHGSKHNIVTNFPRVRPSALHCKTIQDAWGLFFPDTVITKIVDFTNSYLREQQPKYSRPDDYKLTSKPELMAVLGLLYISGALKYSHQHLNDLWEDDGTGVEVFRVAMTIRRFRFLLRCIRFDDLNTQKERRATDRLAPIRDMFSDFVSACEKHFTPGEYMAVDEMLEKFIRGRCPFKVHMKSKPGKSGIKIYALVDTKTFYVSSMEIYAGQQPEGPFANSNEPSDVVKRLVAPISGTGRNVTMGNSFSSVPLAIELLEKHNLTMVGTLRKNKREVPQSFLPSKRRELHSSMFGFQNHLTLVSYVPEISKCVLLISSRHHDGTVSDAPERKPDILSLYNSTKAEGVMDEIKDSNSVARMSRRWPLMVFFSMVDIAGINSQIIYQSNTGEKLTRRKYLKQLGLDLLQEYMTQRNQNPRLPNDLKRRLAPLCGEGSKVPRLSKLGRCYLCSSSKNRRTQQSCRDCHRYICREHLETVCTECSEKDRSESDTEQKYIV